MDADLRDAAPGGQLGERDEMPVVRMDAARTDQADDVEPARRLVAARDRQAATRAGTVEERAVGDRGVDPREILEHGPARRRD